MYVSGTCRLGEVEVKVLVTVLVVVSHAEDTIPISCGEWCRKGREWRLQACHTGKVQVQVLFKNLSISKACCYIKVGIKGIKGIKGRYHCCVVLLRKVFGAQK